MSSGVETVRLVHRVVGAKHVFTSPDVPELHVSHADYETARECRARDRDDRPDEGPRRRARSGAGEDAQRRVGCVTAQEMFTRI